jgi:hypothetical protein
MLRRSLVASLVVAALGCSTSATSTAYTPVTGIYVRADSLVSDYGCGTHARQVFNYAAVVYDDAMAVRGAGLFPCYADGLFANLVGSTTSNFTLKVYAFDEAAYDSQKKIIDVAIGATDANGNLVPQTDTLEHLRTYGTDCVATQQNGIQVLAVCKPLR